jgi:hypothetical protein
MSFVYPKREPFFSHRFTRLMSKVCLANEIGPAGCWLLTVIVHTEDAGGYLKPVTFWNGQLMSHAGIPSEDALERLRSKCVKAGWLSYKKGSSGRAPSYFVVIPDALQCVSDTQSGEEFASTTRDGAGENADQNAGSSRIKTRVVRGSKRGQSPEEIAERSRKDRGESAEHSSLSLTLTQEETPKAPFASGDHETLRKMFDAIVEVTGSDSSLHGSRIGGIRKKLLAASPPYTPEEVLRFGELCASGHQCGFLKGGKPSLNNLIEFIPRVRDPTLGNGHVHRNGRESEADRRNRFIEEAINSEKEKTS